jgi:hypothetical protein
MPEKDAEPPAGRSGSGKGKDAGASARAKSSRAKQGHFLTTREREVLRSGPKLVQSTRREYDSRRLERDRRDLASDHARAKRKALASAQAALEDLAFLANVMDPDWLYELATHIDARPGVPLEELKRLGLPEPPGVPLAIAQAFEMEAVLPRLLEGLAQKVGGERAPEVEPMMDPHNLSLWPQGYKQGGEVRLQRRGAALVALWLAGMERGLNASEQGRQVHTLTHSIRAPTPPPTGDTGFGRKGRRTLPRGRKPDKAPK